MNIDGHRTPIVDLRHWIVNEPSRSRILELELLREFRAHPRHAQAVAFSPDGREMITTGMDALAQVWSVGEFDNVRSFEGHQKSVNAVAIAPDGALAVTGSTDRTVIVWDWKSGDRIHQMKGYRNTVASAAFSPTGRVAAVSSYDGRVGLWEPGADELRIFQSHPRHVTSVSFSPDGRSLASAGIGVTVKIWEVADGELRHAFDAPGESAVSCRFLDDGRLCTVSYDGRIATFDGQSFELLTSGVIPDVTVSSMAPISGSESLLCSVQGGVRVIDLRTLGQVARVDTGIKGMYGVGASPDGDLLAAVSADGRCRIWTLAS